MKKRQPSVNDPYSGIADFVRRTKSNQYRDKAIKRKESKMAYKLPAYDPEGGGEFDPIRPGSYETMVEVLELKYGQESGLPYVSWTFVITDGEFKNRKIWNNTSLSEKAINMPNGWWQSVRAVGGQDFIDWGQSEEWDDEEGMVESMADVLCGRLVKLGIANRKYQGKVQNDVTAVMGMNSPPVEKTLTEELEGPAKPTAPKPSKPAKPQSTKAKDLDF